MKEFANVKLRLNEGLKKGDKKSLLTLFNAAERFKTMDVLTSANEDSIIRVILEQLGEIDLKLGADIEKGQKKTIMTLFWFSERSKPFEIKKNAEAGEDIPIKMLLVTRSN
jgi:hypothetical protein